MDKIPPVSSHEAETEDEILTAPFGRSLGLMVFLLVALLALMVSAAVTAPKPITPETVPVTH